MCKDCKASADLTVFSKWFLNPYLSVRQAFETKLLEEPVNSLSEECVISVMRIYPLMSVIEERSL